MTFISNKYFSISYTNLGAVSYTKKTYLRLEEFLPYKPASAARVTQLKKSASLIVRPLPWTKARSVARINNNNNNNNKVPSDVLKQYISQDHHEHPF